MMSFAEFFGVNNLMFFACVKPLLEAWQRYWERCEGAVHTKQLLPLCHNQGVVSFGSSVCTQQWA